MLSSGEAQAVATYPAGQVAGSRLPLTAQKDFALFPVGVTGSESFEAGAFPLNDVLKNGD